MKNKVWDKKKLKMLETLWEKGLPITKIGDELGVSRNSIAGKAHRMGLPKRNSPISKVSKSINKKNDYLKRIDVPLKISLRNVEWSRSKCCWPIGDPKVNGFKFCGKDIVIGRPYCNKHSDIAYTNTREN